jgi:hypothetical protein
MNTRRELLSLALAAVAAPGAVILSKLFGEQRLSAADKAEAAKKLKIALDADLNNQPWPQFTSVDLSSWTTEAT